MFENIEFTQKYYFILLLLIPIVLFLFFKKQKYNEVLFFEDIKKVFNKNSIFFYLKALLIVSILSLMIIIIANPNKVNTNKEIKKNWIDIILLLDVSPSMDTPDLQPSRIEAAKKVIYDFISNAKTDRLWLVVFSWKPFESIPLTFDYNILKQTIKNLSTNTLRVNWTDIWDSLMLAKSIFEKQIKKKDFKKRQKVIILITDWDSNVGINPLLAAKYLAESWIKIYTIWIWWKKPLFISWMWVVPPLNSKTLKEIANISHAKFFIADSNYSFSRIFSELKKLQTNDIDVKITKKYSQYYYDYALLLLILFVLFMFLSFKRIRV